MPDVTMLIKPASGLCNMRCKYCFYYGAPDHQNGIMTDETLEKLMQRVFEYAGDKVSNITLAWQGGEPTLAGEAYFEKAVSLSKELNTVGHHINYTIQTNGLEISERMTELFAREHFLVGVSLDGMRELHDLNRLDISGRGTFDRVQKTIKLLKKHNVDFNVLCVVSRAASRNPVKVYNALTRSDLDFIQFIPCLDEKGESREYSLDNERFGRFLCAIFDCWFNDIMDGKRISIRDFDNYLLRAAGRPSEICTMRGVCGCYFTVESNGCVYPCDFYVAPEWMIGDVHKDSLSDMLKSDNAIRFIEDSKNHPKECINCKWYGFCGSGCRRQRTETGTNRFCEAYKQFFEHAYDRIAYIAARFLR